MLGKETAARSGKRAAATIAGAECRPWKFATVLFAGPLGALSDDIVETILEQPDGLKIGGEKRQATILMSDLRGFTSLSEGLPAEDVVAMVNIYLETMTDITAMRYQGTLMNLSGTESVIFGAPLQRPDDAPGAVACAVAMQQAMAAVNERNRRAGYPRWPSGSASTTASR